jgi:hypothetical protein
VRFARLQGMGRHIATGLARNALSRKRHGKPRVGVGQFRARRRRRRSILRAPGGEWLNLINNLEQANLR